MGFLSKLKAMKPGASKTPTESDVRLTAEASAGTGSGSGGTASEKTSKKLKSIETKVKKVKRPISPAAIVKQTFSSTALKQSLANTLALGSENKNSSIHGLKKIGVSDSAITAKARRFKKFGLAFSPVQMALREAERKKTMSAAETAAKQKRSRKELELSEKARLAQKEIEATIKDVNKQRATRKELKEMIELEMQEKGYSVDASLFSQELAQFKQAARRGSIGMMVEDDLTSRFTKYKVFRRQDLGIMSDFDPDLVPEMAEMPDTPTLPPEEAHGTNKRVKKKRSSLSSTGSAGESSVELSESLANGGGGELGIVPRVDSNIAGSTGLSANQLNKLPPEEKAEKIREARMREYKLSGTLKPLSDIMYAEVYDKLPDETWAEWEDPVLYTGPGVLEDKQLPRDKVKLLLDVGIDEDDILTNAYHPETGALNEAYFKRKEIKKLQKVHNERMKFELGKKNAAGWRQNEKFRVGTKRRKNDPGIGHIPFNRYADEDDEYAVSALKIDHESPEKKGSKESPEKKGSKEAPTNKKDRKEGSPLKKSHKKTAREELEEQEEKDAFKASLWAREDALREANAGNQKHVRKKLKTVEWLENLENDFYHQTSNHLVPHRGLIMDREKSNCGIDKDNKFSIDKKHKYFPHFDPHKFRDGVDMWVETTKYNKKFSSLAESLEKKYEYELKKYDAKRPEISAKMLQGMLSLKNRKQITMFNKNSALGQTIKALGPRGAGSLSADERHVPSEKLRGKAKDRTAEWKKRRIEILRSINMNERSALDDRPGRQRQRATFGKEGQFHVYDSSSNDSDGDDGGSSSCSDHIYVAVGGGKFRVPIRKHDRIRRPDLEKEGISSSHLEASSSSSSRGGDRRGGMHFDSRSEASRSRSEGSKHDRASNRHDRYDQRRSASEQVQGSKMDSAGDAASQLCRNGFYDGGQRGSPTMDGSPDNLSPKNNRHFDGQHKGAMYDLANLDKPEERLGSWDNWFSPADVAAGDVTLREALGKEKFVDIHTKNAQFFQEQVSGTRAALRQDPSEGQFIKHALEKRQSITGTKNWRTIASKGVSTDQEARTEASAQVLAKNLKNPEHLMHLDRDVEGIKREKNKKKQLRQKLADRMLRAEQKGKEKAVKPPKPPPLPDRKFYEGGAEFPDDSSEALSTESEDEYNARKKEELLIKETLVESAVRLDIQGSGLPYKREDIKAAMEIKELEQQAETDAKKAKLLKSKSTQLQKPNSMPTDDSKKNSIARFVQDEDDSNAAADDDDKTSKTSKTSNTSGPSGAGGLFGGFSEEDHASSKGHSSSKTLSSSQAQHTTSSSSMARAVNIGGSSVRLGSLNDGIGMMKAVANKLAFPIKAPPQLALDFDSVLLLLQKYKNQEEKVQDRVDKLGEQVRHRGKNRKYANFKENAGRIIAEFCEKQKKVRLKNYREKNRNKPMPKSNITDPGSWVRIYNFSTEETSYWRYEAYNFVMNALEEGMDVVPITKKNFAVFQEKVDQTREAKYQETLRRECERQEVVRKIESRKRKAEVKAARQKQELPAITFQEDKEPPSTLTFSDRDKSKEKSGDRDNANANDSMKQPAVNQSNKSIGRTYSGAQSGKSNADISRPKVVIPDDMPDDQSDKSTSGAEDAQSLGKSGSAQNLVTTGKKDTNKGLTTDSGQQGVTHLPSALKLPISSEKKGVSTSFSGASSLMEKGAFTDGDVDLGMSDQKKNLLAVPGKNHTYDDTSTDSSGSLGPTPALRGRKSFAGNCKVGFVNGATPNRMKLTSQWIGAGVRIGGHVPRDSRKSLNKKSKRTTSWGGGPTYRQEQESFLEKRNKRLEKKMMKAGLHLGGGGAYSSDDYSAGGTHDPNKKFISYQQRFVGTEFEAEQKREREAKKRLALKDKDKQYALTDKPVVDVFAIEDSKDDRKSTRLNLGQRGDADPYDDPYVTSDRDTRRKARESMFVGAPKVDHFKSIAGKTYSSGESSGSPGVRKSTHKGASRLKQASIGTSYSRNRFGSDESGSLKQKVTIEFDDGKTDPPPQRKSMFAAAFGGASSFRGDKKMGSAVSFAADTAEGDGPTSTVPSASGQAPIIVKSEFVDRYAAQSPSPPPNRRSVRKSVRKSAISPKMETKKSAPRPGGCTKTGRFQLSAAEPEQIIMNRAKTIDEIRAEQGLVPLARQGETFGHLAEEFCELNVYATEKDVKSRRSMRKMKSILNTMGADEEGVRTGDWRKSVCAAANAALYGEIGRQSMCSGSNANSGKNSLKGRRCSRNGRSSIVSSTRRASGEELPSYQDAFNLNLSYRPKQENDEQDDEYNYNMNIHPSGGDNGRESMPLGDLGRESMDLDGSGRATMELDAFGSGDGQESMELPGLGGAHEMYMSRGNSKELYRSSSKDSLQNVPPLPGHNEPSKMQSKGSVISKASVIEDLLNEGDHLAFNERDHFAAMNSVSASVVDTARSELPSNGTSETNNPATTSFSATTGRAANVLDSHIADAIDRRVAAHNAAHSVVSSGKNSANGSVASSARGSTKEKSVDADNVNNIRGDAKKNEGNGDVDDDTNYTKLFGGLANPYTVPSVLEQEDTNSQVSCYRDSNDRETNSNTGQRQAHQEGNHRKMDETSSVTGSSVARSSKVGSQNTVPMHHDGIPIQQNGVSRNTREGKHEAQRSIRRSRGDTGGMNHASYIYPAADENSNVGSCSSSSRSSGSRKKRVRWLGSTNSGCIEDEQYFSPHSGSDSRVGSERGRYFEENGERGCYYERDMEKVQQYSCLTEGSHHKLFEPEGDARVSSRGIESSFRNSHSPRCTSPPRGDEGNMCIGGTNLSLHSHGNPDLSTPRQCHLEPVRSSAAGSSEGATLFDPNLNMDAGFLEAQNQQSMIKKSISKHREDEAKVKKAGREREQGRQAELEANWGAEQIDKEPAGKFGFDINDQYSMNALGIEDYFEREHETQEAEDAKAAKRAKKLGIKQIQIGVGNDEDPEDQTTRKANFATAANSGIGGLQKMKGKTMEEDSEDSPYTSSSDSEAEILNDISTARFLEEYREDTLEQRDLRSMRILNTTEKTGDDELSPNSASSDEDVRQMTKYEARSKELWKVDQLKNSTVLTDRFRKVTNRMLSTIGILTKNDMNAERTAEGDANITGIEMEQADIGANIGIPKYRELPISGISKPIVIPEDTDSDDVAREIWQRRPYIKKQMSHRMRLRKRKLLGVDHLMKNVVGTVEISAETRIRMIEGLTSQWNRRGFTDLKKAYKHLQPTCCYLSYRFLSLLEVINSFEKSAMLTEHNYMRLFYTAKRGGKYDIGSVAITKAIRNIVETTAPPRLPPINVITGLSTSNLDEGHRLRGLKLKTEEDRIELDENGNLTLVHVKYDERLNPNLAENDETQRDTKKFDESETYINTVKNGLSMYRDKQNYAMTEEEKDARDYDKDLTESRAKWFSKSQKIQSELSCKFQTLQPLGEKPNTADDLNAGNGVSGTSLKLTGGIGKLHSPMKIKLSEVDKAEIAKSQQSIPQHYIYILTEVDGGREDFLTSIREIARDAWALTRKGRTEIMAMIAEEIPKIAESILGESTDDLFTRMDKAVLDLNKTIHIPRKEINALLQAERDEEDRLSKNQEKHPQTAFASVLGGISEDDIYDNNDYGVQINPYSNFCSTEITDTSNMIGGSSWEENKAQLAMTDTTAVIKGMNEKDEQNKMAEISSSKGSNAEPPLPEPELSPASKIRKARQDEKYQEKQALIDMFYNAPAVESLDEFLGKNAYGDVEFDRNLSFAFVREYFQIPEKEVLYFSAGQNTLTDIFRDKDRKIVDAVNIVYDTIQRQLNLSRELLRAAELLNLPDPEVELGNMEGERQRRYENEKRRLMNAAREVQRQKAAERAELEELLAMEEDDEDSELSSDLTPIEHSESESEKSEIIEIPKSHLGDEELKGTKMLVNKHTGAKLLPAPDNIEELMKDSVKIETEQALEVSRKGVEWLYRGQKGSKLQKAIRESMDRKRHGKRSKKKLNAQEINYKGTVITSRQIAVWEDQERRNYIAELQKGGSGGIAKHQGTGVGGYGGSGGYSSGGYGGTPSFGHSLLPPAQRTQSKDSRASEGSGVPGSDLGRVGSKQEELLKLPAIEKPAINPATFRHPLAVPQCSAAIKFIQHADEDIERRRKLRAERDERRRVAEEAEEERIRIREDAREAFRQKQREEEDDFDEMMQEEAELKPKAEDVIPDGDPICPDSDSQGSDCSERPVSPHVFQPRVAEKEDKTTKMDLVFSRYAMCDHKLLTKDIKTLLAVAREQTGRPKFYEEEADAENGLNLYAGWNTYLEGHPRILIDILATQYFSPPRFYQVRLDEKVIQAKRVELLTKEQQGHDDYDTRDGNASVNQFGINVIAASAQTTPAFAGNGVGGDSQGLGGSGGGIGSQGVKIHDDAFKSFKVAKAEENGGGGSFVAGFKTGSKTGSCLAFGNHMTLGTATIQAANEYGKDNKVRRNAYLVEINGKLDPFAKIFKDVVEDICKKFTRFDQRHLVFELVATAVGGPSFDFSPFSRTEQADLICFLAICRLRAMFQRN